MSGSFNKSFLSLSFLILFVNVLSAQSKEDSLAVSKVNKGKANKKSNVYMIDRPRKLLPQSDSPFKLPMLQQRETIVKPETQPTEYNVYKQGLVGTAKTAEDDIDPWGFAVNPRYLNRWFRDITGLRAFYDPIGGTIGLGKHANHRLETYVSVGYQFNPILYLGIGQGYQLSLNKKSSTAPSFVNLRVNFLDDYKTPFFDFRGGYSFLDGTGFYINPSFGMSFGKDKRAFNVSLGYSYQGASYWDKGMKLKEHYHGVSLRVTYEFSIF